jgi:hypothetical protein
VDYNPNQDFIPFPGGEGLGAWDGVSQTWTGSAWDLNTGSAGPWTWQDLLGAHPNGTNSPPTIDGSPDPTKEHWAIRRWVAKELTKDTPATVIWRVRKTNLSTFGSGVTGLLFINGKHLDSKAIEALDGTNPARQVTVTLKSTDIVDLALSPVGPSGDRGDGSDGSETWFWVDTRPVTTKPTLSGTTVNVAQGQCTFSWSSQPGLKYSVWISSDLTNWSALKTGLDSGGATTSYVDALPSPVPGFRFYKVSQP